MPKTNPDNMATWTGRQMHDLRKHLRDSQGEFAKRIGLTRQASVSDMERGEMVISERTMVILDLLAQQSGFDA